MYRDRYRLVSILKQTQTILVCIVEDQYSSKQFISKSVSKDASPILRHQFHVEIDVLSKLEHPHIPTLIDVLETRQYLTFIETYYDGVSLDEYDKKLPLKMVHVWLSTIFDLLDAIHKIGYLYIDLKPHNIIIKDHELYLIDFNACIERNEESPHMMSFFNQAPEFNFHCPLDISSDIYGLGALILYLYPKCGYRLLARVCQREDPKKRFQTIDLIRKFEQILYIWKRYLKYVFIILSVFLLIFASLLHKDPFHAYLKSPTADRFISAYQYTLNQNKEYSRIQDTLYQWLEKNWISNAVLTDKECVTFLLKQSLLSKNISLCSTVLDKIPKDVQQECIDLVIMAKVYVSQIQTLDASTMHQYICSIQTKHLSTKQYIEECTILLNVLVECEIILGSDDLTSLYRMIDSMQGVEQKENLLKLYVSYGLICKEQNIEFLIPSWLKQALEKEDNYSEIINYLGG